MSGSATFATARFRLATAATRISATSTKPARSGAVDGSVAGALGARGASAIRVSLSLRIGARGDGPPDRDDDAERRSFLGSPDASPAGVASGDAHRLATRQAAVVDRHPLHHRLVLLRARL